MRETSHVMHGINKCHLERNAIDKQAMQTESNSYQHSSLS